MYDYDPCFLYGICDVCYFLRAYMPFTVERRICEHSFMGVVDHCAIS